MAKTNNRLLFWLVVVGVVSLDFITKQIAVAQLSDRRPAYLLGEWLSLRLVYNEGAAFGISVGTHSRWVFMALALVALVVLGAMVRQTPPKQWFRLLTLGLVCGGAIGNLIDRVIRFRGGVVDFIDVWIGTFHWPTFNVADMAVSCGAIALAVVLWSDGKHEKEVVGEAASPAEAST